MGANKHELKKGDRVTRGDWHAIGTIISTHEKHGQGYAEIDYGEWGNWKFRLTELKLIHRPAEPAPLFAVGDKVRLKSAEKWGERGVGEVVETDGGDDDQFVGVVYPGDTFQWHFEASEIEPAPFAASNDSATPAKFKVGDRVRATDDRDGLTKGEAYTISGYASSTDIGRWVYLQGITSPYSDDGSYLERDFEPTPLTIQAGRFYKSRDGRKVGPAWRDERHPYAGDFPWRVGNYTYTDSGKVGFVEDDDDLIAEWPAETEVAASGECTLGESEATPVDATLTTKITVDFTDFDAELRRIFARLRKLRRKSKKMGIKIDSGGLQDAA